MISSGFLFDSNIIYRLIRELPEEALNKLSEGSTIYLAYYELGNALWRECRLLKRISVEEAKKSLDLMYAMLERMHVGEVNGENGSEVLEAAHKFNLTFYDSAYLIAAKKNSKTLVTDDQKLTKAANHLGVVVLSSNAFIMEVAELKEEIDRQKPMLEKVSMEDVVKSVREDRGSL